MRFLIRFLKPFSYVRIYDLDYKDRSIPIPICSKQGKNKLSENTRCIKRKWEGKSLLCKLCQ